MLSSVVENIGPGKAQEYLALVGHQRRVTQSHVDKLARSMELGHWRMTGEPIQFDRQGSLINGQHRLHALIRTGLSFPFVVIRGLDHNAYEVMDQGKMRSKGETLATLGMKNATSSASVCQILLRLKYGLEVDRIQVDNAEIMAFAKANFHTLEEAVYQSQRFRELPSPAYGAGLFLALHAARDRALDFADLVATGAGLEKTSPILALRNKAFALRRSPNRLEEGRPSNFLPIVVRAFDAFINGEPLTRFITRLGEPNYYPKLINAERFWDDK